MPDSPSAANAEVLAFYRELPFNYRGSPQDDVARIKASDLAASYPELLRLIRREIGVLDVGCGAGWLSNSIAYHHRCSVTGIDFNEVAIRRAREVAAGLRVAASFETADLFGYEPAQRADIAVSLGVLHHTNDCLRAVARVCERFVGLGGYVFIGLYHRYGRRPFLNHFARLRATGAGEDAMMARYAELDRRFRGDPVHLRSWFRDQVLHPHETQHTLAEIVPVLQRCGMELISSSINQFKPFGSLDELYALEPGYTEIAQARLAENRYFPGFFIFLARKR
jgi:SAM-dependent methyltransferase